MVSNNEHLTMEGLSTIVNIRASLNLGLSKELKEAFPSFVCVDRAADFSITIRDPQWLSGFASAEGCYFVYLRESKSYSSGYQVIK